MPDQPHVATFADRLDALFVAEGDRTGVQPAYASVVEELARGGGPEITPTYLYMLRTGRRTNPRVDLVVALAERFKVPVGYFFEADADGRDAEELTLYRALQEADLLPMVRQVQRLSGASREALEVLLDRLIAADSVPVKAKAGRSK